MKYQPKYKYITYERNDGAHVIIALSTYAKKPVKGVAVCHPDDEFDVEKGKALAIARCNEKVAKLRLRRSEDELKMAISLYEDAKKWLDDTLRYNEDAAEALALAEVDVKAICKSL